jgi:hypothetical protein
MKLGDFLNYCYTEPMSHPTFFDFTALDALKELAGEDFEEFLRDLITAYLRQGEEDTLTLHNDLNNSNVQGLTKISHRLKSVSQQIGAVGFAKEIAEIERLGLNHAKVEEFKPLVKEAIRDFQKTKSLLTHYIAVGFKNFNIDSMT